MAKLRKKIAFKKKLKQQTADKVSKKEAKPASKKKGSPISKKKVKKTHHTDVPRVPIVFVSRKPANSDDDANTSSDDSTIEKPTEQPSVLEPIPTDVPDPRLPGSLRKLISPLIGYVYNGEQMSLKLSFEQAGLLLQPEYDEQTRVFRFLVNMKEICKAVGEKVEAHSLARERLVQIIRYYCYTVKRVKEFHTRRKIFYTRPPNPPKDETKAAAIQEENIGFKMMQKQGWVGGALGSNEDGIIEPIVAKKRKGKSGLGTENATKDLPDGAHTEKVKIPLEAFYMLMKQYAGVNALYDLVFSTQFSKPQVAKLKSYASSLKLFPQMIGHKKRLVVSRMLTIKQIKMGVMKGHSDLCAKYVVIPPAAGIPDEDKTVMVKPRKART